jgi:hypothetical protein
LAFGRTRQCLKHGPFLFRQDNPSRIRDCFHATFESRLADQR